MTLGVSLRDYFAAAALQGLYACPEVNRADEILVRASYKIADLMLKERSK